MSKTKKAPPTPRVKILPEASQAGYRYRITQSGRSQDILSETEYKTASAAVQAAGRLIAQVRKLVDEDAIVERCNASGDINSTTTVKAI